MRKINEFIIHCTATPASRDVTVEQIRNLHVKCNRWSDIGYHYVIYRNGEIHTGRPLEQPGAHCKGHNANSIGIAYVGGLLDDAHTPADTRTPEQKASLLNLIARLRRIYPDAIVHSHRDFANKACPCFDATKEYRTLIAVIITAASLLFTSCRSQKNEIRHDTNVQTIEKSIINKISCDSSGLQLNITFDSVHIVTIGQDSSTSIITARNAIIGINRESTSTITETTVSTDSASAIITEEQTLTQEAHDSRFKRLFLIIAASITACITTLCIIRK